MYIELDYGTGWDIVSSTVPTLYVDLDLNPKAESKVEVMAPI